MLRKNELGEGLEEMLDMTCEQYYCKKIATIKKVPTPFKIIGKDPTTNALLCVPDKKSTVDYMGEYRGLGFAMEAKSTESKTSYRIDGWDRESHQRDFLEHWRGLRYYFITFWFLREHYLIPYDLYIEQYNTAAKGGPKSIPIHWFRENFTPIPEGGRVVLDFLKIVDTDLKDKELILYGK